MAVLWTTVGAGMLLTDLTLLDERPISYLGTNGQSMPLFRTGLIVATALLVTFAWAVHRRLARPAGFLAVFLVGMAGQAVVAVVSIVGTGTPHTVHTTAGIILGLSLPVLMWRFAAAQPPGRWRERAFRLMWLEIAVCLAGIGLSRLHRAAVAEALPAGGFHLWIIVVTTRWDAWHRAFDPTPALSAPSA